MLYFFQVEKVFQCNVYKYVVLFVIILSHQKVFQNKCIRSTFQDVFCRMYSKYLIDSCLQSLVIIDKRLFDSRVVPRFGIKYIKYVLY